MPPHLIPAADSYYKLGTIQLPDHWSHLCTAILLLCLILWILVKSPNDQKIFHVLILTLPWIKGLTIKIGAQWELYIPLCWILLLRAWLKTSNPSFTQGFQKYYPHAFLLAAISLFSSAFTLLARQIPPLDPAQTFYFKNPWTLTIVENVRFLTCLAILLITLQLVSTEQKLLKTTWFFVVAATLASSIGLYAMIVSCYTLPLPMLSSISIESFLKPGVLRAYGTFYEISQYGSFLLVGLFLSLFLFHIHTRHKTRAILALCSLTIYAGLMFSFSLTALYVLPAALTAYLVFSNNRNQVLAGTVLILLTTITLYGFRTWQRTQPVYSAKIGRVFHEPTLEGLPTRKSVLIETPKKIFDLSTSANDRNIETAAYHGTLRAKQLLFGFGQGIGLLFHVQTAYYRIFMDLGVAGFTILSVLMLRALRSLKQVRNFPSLSQGYPAWIASYVALAGVLVHYVKPTDAWIWFLIALFLIPSTIAHATQSSPTT